MKVKVVTTYISELGNTFTTPEQAIADDDRLPRLIAAYESDLMRMETLEMFGGKPRMPEELDELKSDWKAAIARYRKMWIEVQESRVSYK